eukprot:1259243-Amphidinium_carterae.1
MPRRGYILQSRTTNKLLQRTMKRKHVQQEGFLVQQNSTQELPKLPTLTAGTPGFVITGIDDEAWPSLPGAIF